MRRYSRVVMAMLALCFSASAYTQAAAAQPEENSTPAIGVQDLDRWLKEWGVALDDLMSVDNKLPYSLKTEWVVDLKKVCPECMTPEHSPGNAVSITLQPPHALVGDGARATDECALYKALIASLREAKVRDALLIAAYKREIVALHAKVKTLEAQ